MAAAVTEVPADEARSESPSWAVMADASLLSTINSAIARCPPETWFNILCHTGDPYAYAYAGWGESINLSAKTEIFRSWYRGKHVPWNDGTETLGNWNLRLVCRAWNELLRPVLFESLWVPDSADQLQQAIARLQTGTDERPVGQFVRSFFLRSVDGRAADPVGDPTLSPSGTTTSFLIHKILDLCPRVDRIVSYSALNLTVDCLPASTSGIKTLFLQCSGPPDNAFLDLLTVLPALEVLDLGEMLFPPVEELGIEVRKARTIPALQSLAIRVDRSYNVSFLHAMAYFRLPCLRNLFVMAEEKYTHPASLAEFLGMHGTSLKSLIFSSDTRMYWNYDQELALLSLCPNLEEYVTRLPNTTWQNSFPTLRHLRQIGIVGTCPSNIWYSRNNWHANEELWSIAFCTKLAEANLPSLLVVKALDRQYTPWDGWGTALTEFQAKVTGIFEPYGIRFEDAGGAFRDDLTEIGGQGPS